MTQYFMGVDGGGSKTSAVIINENGKELGRSKVGASNYHLTGLERLKTLLGGLPEVQRSAFLLKEEGGLSLQQIASCTGVGRETVKSRLRYALKSLRKGLEGCDDAT